MTMKIYEIFIFMQISAHFNSVLGMTLNCIRWWGSSPGRLEWVEYNFIVITPSMVVPVKVPSMDQIDPVKLFSLMTYQSMMVIQCQIIYIYIYMYVCVCVCVIFKGILCR